LSAETVPAVAVTTPLVWVIETIACPAVPWAVPEPIASMPSLTALATEPAVVLSPFKVLIAESIPLISSLIASKVAASSLAKVPFKALIAVSI